jgi:predicted  nucleic acid-binding Zn-ribbon protein
MAWFLNQYRCDRCRKVWTDEWSCMCEDDCPHCGCRHMTPFASQDLTTLVGRENETFVVLRSPESAEHDPDYREVGRFPTFAEAEAFVATP